MFTKEMPALRSARQRLSWGWQRAARVWFQSPHLLYIAVNEWLAAPATRFA